MTTRWARMGIWALGAVVLGAGCAEMDSNAQADDEPVAALASALVVNSQLDSSFHLRKTDDHEATSAGTTLAFSQGDGASAVTDVNGKLAWTGTRYFDKHYLGLVGRMLANGEIDTGWNASIPVPSWRGSDRVLDFSDDPEENVWANDIVFDNRTGLLYVGGAVEAGGRKRGFVQMLDGRGDTIYSVGTLDDLRQRTIMPPGFTSFSVSEVALDKQGRLVIAGIGYKSTSITAPPILVLGRFYPAIPVLGGTVYGAPDLTFGGDGYVTRSLEGEDYPPKMAIGQDRAEIYILEAKPALLYRFAEDGTFDSRYGKKALGGVGKDIAVNSHAYAYALTESRGDLATSFDASGETADSIRFLGLGLAAQNLVKIAYSEPLGRVFVTGEGLQHLDADTRYDRIVTYAATPDLRLDESFADHGMAVTNIAGVLGEQARAILPQGDKLVVAGTGDSNTHAPFVRYAIDTGGVAEPCRLNGQCDNHDLICRPESVLGLPFDTACLAPFVIVISPPAVPGPG
jgi:hypothetical protein